MSYCIRIACIAFAVTLIATPRLSGQNSDCNVPAKDPIDHLEMPGKPFEPVISPDGCWIFVTLTQNGSNGGGIAVVRRANGTVSIARTIPIKGNPTGAVLTHDGKLLVVADGGYLAFLDAARLQSGDDNPVLGYFGDGSPMGYIYANVTADDKYLIVSAERDKSVLVIDLERTRADGFKGLAGAAKLDVGNAPVAVTLSADGRFLYTTSEAALQEWNWPSTCRSENPRASARNHPQGAIIVFDFARVLSDPAHAAISRMPAGCNPVRLVLSPRGDIAYVTARGDNTLLAFDAQRLAGDTAHALIGRAEVGVSPVGIAVIDDGSRVVVTSSNRFDGSANDHQPLTVIDVALLRAGRPATTAVIQAGAFPRELRLTADGSTLFVTNFASQTLQIIDLTRVRR